jgi:tetratricopeptide (TPR) repeat protein
MPPSFSTVDDRELPLDEVLATYHRAAAMGQPPSRQALFDAHPELADALHDFFADADHIERLAAPLRAAVTVGPSQIPQPELGDYELLAEIAHGGMGVVYRARHKRLQRLVALKVLRAGPFASPAEWQRFRNEAEAIAHLDHPGIVPIYEIGETGGLPFFTMKLLEGSLAQHGGRYREDPRAAAKLLAAVAEAIHYAHERGILHRDLKPANILLDAGGQPHVSDFGLAKRFPAGDATTPAVTHSGDVLGTPSYMAPEQALGTREAITTAADVYGLGTILYELITGQPPFRGASSLEILRQLQEQEPTRPSAVNARIDRNLETICLKCLHKEPAQRYRSAAALGQDLRRYLAGEMIAARPAGTLERIRGWYRRRPLVASLLLSLAVLFFVAFGLVTWMWRRAEISDAAREGQRIQAEAARDKAQRILDEFADQLSDVPADNQPAFPETRRRMLQSALKYYQEFLLERGDDAHLQAEIARAQFLVGAITATLGSRPEALAAYEQALTLTRQLNQQSPGDVLVRLNLARTLNRIGLLQVETGQPWAGLAAYQEARELWDALRREKPDDPAIQADLAGLQINIATAHSSLGRSDEAGTCLRASVLLLEDLIRRYPDQADYRASLALCLSNLGTLHGALAQRQDGIDCLTRARDLLRPLIQDNPTKAQFQDELSLVLLNLGGQLNAPGQRDAALQALNEGKQIVLRRLQENPGGRPNQNRLATYERQLGLVYRESGRLDDAAAALERSLRAGEPLLRADPGDLAYGRGVASCYFDLALLHERRGRRDDMFRCYEQARQRWQDLVDRSPEQVAYRHSLGLTLNNLGHEHWRSKRPHEALASLERARDHNRLVLSKAPKVHFYRRILSTTYLFLAEVHRGQGRAADAVAAALERRKLWPGDADQLFFVACDLAQTTAGMANDQKSAVRKAQWDEYRGYALDTLRQAVRSGFRDVERLEREARLAELRANPGFKALVEELKAKIPKTPRS